MIYLLSSFTQYKFSVMNLLDERGPSYPVIKTGGIASLLGATLNIAERTKDQNTYESIRCEFLL